MSGVRKRPCCNTFPGMAHTRVCQARHERSTKEQRPQEDQSQQEEEQ